MVKDILPHYLEPERERGRGGGGEERERERCEHARESGGGIKKVRASKRVRGERGQASAK